MMFVIILLIISVVLGSSWLALISIATLFLLSIAMIINRRFKEQTAPAGGTGKKHKLIQASMDAWDNEDIFTYLVAMSGTRPLPINAPEDPLKAINKAFGPNRKIPADIVRNILPFRNYGRETVFEQIFISFPISIGKLIKNPYKK